MVKTKDCQVRVLYADTDAMGIVYNGTYIAWLEKGRTEWLRQAGYSYKKIEEMGLLLPVSHIDIEYRHPAHYDDLLTIKTWIEKVKGATIIIGYDIVNEDGIVNVHAVSEHPITDRNLKPIRIRRDLPELYAILKEEEK
ncbi:MAG: thioesterase family protein [Eubacteriales bacterium]|nr:thioesterase family protein [Eubacteriales bacterium]